jgi:transcriptional regulator GlxA family with amidase domain
MPGSRAQEPQGRSFDADAPRPAVSRSASAFALDANRTAALSLVLMPGFALGDLARLLDVFNAANGLAANTPGGRGAFRWDLLSPVGMNAVSSSGIAVTVQGELDARPPHANVLVLSDVYAPGADCAALAAWLGIHRKAIQRLGGIGGGCQMLGRLAAMPPERARANADRKELYWRQRDLFGCRGGCATSDFALSNVEALLGPQIAQRVLTQLARERLRKRIEPAAEQRQSIETEMAPPIRAAAALMRRTVAQPLPIPAIAAEAGVHLRHLERLFHRHLGVSPRGYYQRLRLARARELVQGTMMGLSQVAEQVGFDSLSHFSKCYMDAHGIRPSEDRQRHFTTPGETAVGGQRSMPAGGAPSTDISPEPTSPRPFGQPAGAVHNPS